MNDFFGIFDTFAFLRPFFVGTSHLALVLAGLSQQWKGELRSNSVRIIVLKRPVICVPRLYYCCSSERAKNIAQTPS